MSVINDLIEQIENPELRMRVQQEVNKLNKQRKFGLVFEEHTPENTLLYDVPVRRGTLVAKRENDTKDTYVVINIDSDNVVCEHTVSHEQVTMAKGEVVVVAQLGDPIYPYLKPMGSVQNAPDSELWHTLIEADNYHALQLLAYLYAGQVDCIYIDPPYNSGATDWKYNNNYVDGNDSYKHSKWLSMIEKRLLLAKKLLNPYDSVLIIAIDENEYHHLGCLLEQMFPNANIQMVSTVINPSGVARENSFSRTDEYLYYVKLGNSSPSKLQLPKDWITANSTGKDKVRWRPIRRQGSHDTRADANNQFYPIFISIDGTHIIDAGETLPEDMHPSDYTCPSDCIVLWPLKPNGEEGCWQISQDSLRLLKKQGYIKLGYSKKWGYTPKYLAEGERKKVENGLFPVIGRDLYGTLIIEDASDEVPFIPGTQWRISSHSAREQGTSLLSKFIENRFSFPKSLYAEHDAIRFFVANKPNALILDFFAGSGTTLHAVNLLNAEDGGRRRCIMVTNNEIGETKENELKPQGIRPGDEEWEKWGIARYVNWPRTECSIKGVDVNGKPIEGEYITTNTEKKFTDRNISQIDFFAEEPNLAKKKKLVTFINKQKDVKLPTMKEDAPYLLAEEDDSCNATVLFDVEVSEEWLEALDGHDEITNIYIVTSKGTVFKRIKESVVELLGQVEETIPVKMPMADGFKANASYFKLGFLDKTSVALGRQFKELLPLLWMKTGARGECPELAEEELPQMMICEKNHFAVLIYETAYHAFEKEMQDKKDIIDTVFFVTDSNRGFKEMTEGIGVDKTYQLYRDYLDNFRINNIK